MCVELYKMSGIHCISLYADPVSAAETDHSNIFSLLFYYSGLNRTQHQHQYQNINERHNRSSIHANESHEQVESNIAPKFQINRTFSVTNCLFAVELS